QLRKVIGDHMPSTVLPTTLTDDMQIILEPLEVQGVRVTEGGEHEVLIKWKELPDYEATWESYLVMRT
uniref:chromo domain-containing protein n=1 Tax=Streptococcus anginosus TaxID=1328 RepID=UPI002ED95276